MDANLLELLLDEYREQSDIRSNVQNAITLCKGDSMTEIDVVLENLLVYEFSF